MSFLKWSPVGFPQAAVPQEMFQRGSLPQEWTAPPWAPLHGLQLTQVCSSWGFLWTVASFRPHPLLHCGVLHGCSWRSAPYCAHGLQGAACSTTDLSWASESFCSLPGTPPSVTLRATQGCFSLSHFSLLSPSCCCTAAFPVLNCSLRDTLE